MIDVVVENERNLKNVRQIGKPGEEDKIYIEDTAYARVHAEDYADKRIFIFMGHTECENNRYTTFVEAAIPVPDITFQQNVPQWSSHAWSDIFQEIKRAYDNSIIVGWAMDNKGFSPKITPELEAVHREQFGGAHQVLFLMDSVEGEERFFMNKGNSLQEREGFFIYYGPKTQKACEAEVTVEVPREAVFRSGRSRLLMGGATPEKEENESGEKKAGRRPYSFVVTAATLLLIGLVGIGVYQDRIKLSDLEEAISVMGGHLETIRGGNDGNTEDTETLNVIPVNQLPSGDIQRVEDSTVENQSENFAESENQSDNSGTETTETAAEILNGEDRGELDQNGVDNDDNEDSEDSTTDAGAMVPEYYIVQRGDTLTSIAQRFYGSLAYIEKVAELNQLEDYDHIREGQKLLLP